METLRLNPKCSHRKGERRSAAKAAFLPVNITDEVVSEATASSAGPSNSNVEIALVNGLRITLNGNFDPDSVAQLVLGLSV